MLKEGNEEKKEVDEVMNDSGEAVSDDNGEQMRMKQPKED